MDNDNESIPTTFDELKAKLDVHRAEIAARTKNEGSHKPGAWPAFVKAESKAGQLETLKPKWTYSVPALPREDVAAASAKASQLAALAERLPKAGERSEIAEEFVETKE